MPLLIHPDLPHHGPKNVPDEDSAVVHREAGWVDYEPPEQVVTPGIVPGTEDQVDSEQAELNERASAVGLKVDRRWGVDTLREKVEEAEADADAGTEGDEK